MKSILVTGGSGFVGKHVIPIIKKKYDIDAPTRGQMDLKNRKSVEEYFCDKSFDAVIHLASPSPVKSVEYDSFETLLKDCLTIFTNLQSVSSHYNKMIYSGSGAEYDKSRDLIQITEEKIGERIPSDDYGLAKYLLTQLARQSTNCYNLRIFGCYGAGEYDYKFIKHAISCVNNNEPITIRQDCYFDYMYVDDYAKYIEYFIEHEPHFHDYNACTGIRVSLSEIAMIVKNTMKSDVPIIIYNEGFNLEYSGSNERIMKETNGTIQLTSLKDGIRKMIKEEGIVI